MVTALAEMDLTLGDDTKFANQIYVLVATWGDVTVVSHLLQRGRCSQAGLGQ